MSGAIGPLSHEDRAFLRDNFEVYDPEMGCHKDFSVLNGVKVIFIMEHHECWSIMKVQDAFLARFERNGDCLALEGQPVLIDVPREVVAVHLPHLPPSIKIVGSDNRVPKPRFIFARKWNEFAKEKAAILNIINVIHEEFAAIINAELRAGRATVDERDVHITPKIHELLITKKHQEDELREQISAKYDELGQYAEKESDKRSLIIQSNQGLVNCLAQLAEDKTAGTIVTIWGETHFINKKRIYEDLKRKSINYCILRPHPEVMAKAREESLEEPLVQLNITSQLSKDRWRDSCCPLPARIALCFDSSVRPLLRPVSSIIWITPEWVRTHLSGTFPSNTSFCIQLLDEEDSLEEKETKSMKDLYYQFRALNLAAGKTFSFNEQNKFNLEEDTNWNDATRYLHFKSKVAVNFMIEERLVITPTELWDYMLKKHLRFYKVLPGVRLILGPLSKALQSILNSLPEISKDIDQMFAEILTASVPAHKTLFYRGEFNVEPVKLDSPCFNAFRCTSNTSFGFCLADKENNAS